MSSLIHIGSDAAKANANTNAPLGKPFALVSMPTLSGEFPSFQLGLLKPTLERAGIDCQTFSLFLYFGAHVGWGLNEALSDVSSALVGEWLWAKEVFGEFADDEEYLDRFRSSIERVNKRAGITVDDLLRVRNEAVPSFLDWCLASTDWSRFSAVGLSVVFQQTMASLAFAKRLKAKHPDIPVLLGGGFFEDDIADEVIRGCDFVDVIHCGDADETLPDILRKLDAGAPLDGQPGAMFKAPDGEVRYAGRAPNLTDLSTTPVPEFDEYFYARDQGGYGAWRGTDQVMLPIETARGCWWGMKNHCTFCGLNRAGMEFRSKDVPGVLDMIRTLSRKYGQLHFDAIDNIIEPKYVDALFGQLAAARTDIRIHYEVRPSLKRDQLRLMRQGGLYSVQPGIESLSTHMLQLMNKRTTAMRNLEFMKWCTYFDINNLYNILMRFPGETQADYDDQLELIALIGHLQPPKFVTTARADRGSPMFTQPDDNDVQRLRPAPCYPYLYPADRFDLQRVSYYFEHDMPSALTEADYAPLRAAVNQWQTRWDAKRRPFLNYKKSWETLHVQDGRQPGALRKYTFNERYVNLYEALADAQPLTTLKQRLADEDPGWIDDALAELAGLGLVVSRDDKWLALALPVHRGH